MGVCEADKHLKVDLHGLFIDEAKSVIESYILPVLPVIGKIELITGRGVHNKSNVSKLKLALMQYFAEIKVKCLEMSENPGALCIIAQ
jgi:DNA-nicking Smr family endonuclease